MPRIKKYNTKYSPEFKLAVIIDMREHHLSYHETARKYFDTHSKAGNGGNGGNGSTAFEVAQETDFFFCESGEGGEGGSHGNAGTTQGGSGSSGYDGSKGDTPN